MTPKLAVSTPFAQANYLSPRLYATEAENNDQLLHDCLCFTSLTHTYTLSLSITHTLTPPTHPHTLTPSQELRQKVGHVQSTLVKKLSILDKYEHVLAQVNAVGMERLIDPKTQVNIQALCESPTILAQQLTHIELERLNNIGPEEFIQTFVKCQQETEVCVWG